MDIITEGQSIIDGIRRFKETYENEDISRNGIAYSDIFAKLDSLPDNPTYHDIDGIIDKSWYEVVCNECSKVVDKAIELGESIDDYYDKQKFCLSCLHKAVESMESLIC